MLNDSDASAVLQHLRVRLNNTGFGDFDEFARSIIFEEYSRDSDRPAEPILLRYLDIMMGLLAKVGTTNINRAKSNLTQVLGLDEDIEIILDLSVVRSLVEPSLSDFIELEGSAVAERLVKDLYFLRDEIENFTYPNPGQTPQGGMTP